MCFHLTNEKSISTGSWFSHWLLHHWMAMVFSTMSVKTFEIHSDSILLRWITCECSWARTTLTLRCDPIINFLYFCECGRSNMHIYSPSQRTGDSLCALWLRVSFVPLPLFIQIYVCRCKWSRLCKCTFLSFRSTTTTTTTTMTTATMTAAGALVFPNAFNALAKCVLPPFV